MSITFKYIMESPVELMTPDMFEPFSECEDTCDEKQIDHLRIVELLEIFEDVIENHAGAIYGISVVPTGEYDLTIRFRLKSVSLTDIEFDLLNYREMRIIPLGNSLMLEVTIKDLYCVA